MVTAIVYKHLKHVKCYCSKMQDTEKLFYDYVALDYSITNCMVTMKSHTQKSH